MENQPKNDLTTGEWSLEANETKTPEIETRRIISGVHLGKDRQGRFIDEARAILPEVGIAVTAWQRSSGTTGLRASSLQGQAVESATLDDEGNLVWQSEQTGSDRFVEISTVIGNMQHTPVREYSQAEKLSNPGIQWGVIRITSTNGEQKHFMLAADFTGEADDWVVQAEIAAIDAPKNAGELQTLQNRQLPNA
jgi:hypothetical protein